MPFDPTKPVASSLISSAELRDQFNALKALIDAQPVVAYGKLASDWTSSSSSFHLVPKLRAGDRTCKVEALLRGGAVSLEAVRSRPLP